MGGPAALYPPLGRHPAGGDGAGAGRPAENEGGVAVMATVREIYQYLDGLAPFSLQMDFDNAGFLVGRGDRQVKKLLVALDITQEVAEEAVELGAELI